MQGKIKRFSASGGYGFIGILGRGDCFFHVNESPLVNEDLFVAGQSVEFNVVSNRLGQHASDLRLIPLLDEERSRASGGAQCMV
jgi:cold shock CspA family protein